MSRTDKDVELPLLTVDVSKDDNEDVEEGDRDILREEESDDDRDALFLLLRVEEFDDEVLPATATFETATNLTKRPEDSDRFIPRSFNNLVLVPCWPYSP